MAISLSQIPHMLMYMPLTVYGPCLALKQVAGINELWTSAVIFLVCVGYSSIGGLKAVLWTDALQSMVMLASLIAVIIVGVSNVGGFQVVWDTAAQYGRTNIFNFDFDPRTRHTFWTGIIGGYFNWMPLFGATQTLIQRYLSVPTIEKARSVIWITTCGLVILTLLCSFTGLVIFANYVNCDPVGIDAISSSDQLVPLFVMDVLGDIPVLPGLFVAGLTAGSLSTVSSVLNALAAVITEDYIKKYRPNSTPEALGYFSKIVTAGAGLVAFALIFVIAAVGNILPFASLLHGTFVGPILGIFTLGMFFPWANWLGTLLGTIPAVTFTLFIGIGSIVDKGLPDQKLPLAPEEGCYLNSSNVMMNDNKLLFDNYAATEWKNEEFSVLTQLFSISYMWHAMIPVVFTVFFGLLFSFLVISFKKFPKSEKRLFSQPVLSVWKKLLGQKRLTNYIQEDKDKGADYSE